MWVALRSGEMKVTPSHLQVQFSHLAPSMVPKICIIQPYPISLHERVLFLGHQCKHDENKRRNRRAKSQVYVVQLWLVGLRIRNPRRKLWEKKQSVKKHIEKAIKRILPGLRVRLCILVCHMLVFDASGSSRTFAYGSAVPLKSRGWRSWAWKVI